MPLARAVLMLAGMVLFIGTLWSAAGDSFHLSGDEVRAQELGTRRIHLPFVVADAPVTGGPSEPGPWRPDADFVLGGPAWTVDVVGTVAYVGVGAHLMAYDVSGEAPLTLLGASPPLPGNVRDVVVSDGFAFVAVHQTFELEEALGGLFVLDVRDPTAIEVVAARELRGGATDLDLDKDLLVVTAMSERHWWPRGVALAVFDVSNPQQPDLIRLDPSGGFGSEGSIALRDEILFTCLNGLFAFDLRLPIDSWLVGLDLAPCTAFARVGADTLLAVVSDPDDLRLNTPVLRIFDVRDISMIELIGETPLDAFGDSNTRIDVLDVGAEGASVFVAALVNQSQGTIVQYDVTDPTSPRAVATWSGEGALLAVDSDGGPIVAGAATVAGGSFDFEPGDFDPEPPYVLGSRISILEEVGDSSLRTIAEVDGPGTLLSTVACHDATAYMFEIGTSDSGIGRLWAFDTSDDMPTVSAVMELSQSKEILHVGAPGVVATTKGLFLSHDGQISLYQVRGGRFEAVGAVADSGTLAVSGDHLLVLAENGQLRAYDVSGPESWRRVEELELPSLGPHRYAPHSMIVSEKGLWMASIRSDPSTTRISLADIIDIRDVGLVGTLDLASLGGGPESAWLREGDGDVWLLTAEPSSGSPTTISTLSTSADGSGPVLDKRWIADNTPESIGFPWALAVLDDLAWYVSPYFLHGDGSVSAVQKTDTGHLTHAGTRAAPAAVRSRSTDHYDAWSETYGALSLATCGDRIFGTDLEGGLYGIDPEQWLEGAGAH